MEFSLIYQVFFFFQFSWVWYDTIVSSALPTNSDTRTSSHHTAGSFSVYFYVIYNYHPRLIAVVMLMRLLLVPFSKIRNKLGWGNSFTSVEMYSTSVKRPSWVLELWNCFPHWNLIIIPSSANEIRLKSIRQNVFPPSKPNLRRDNLCTLHHSCLRW